ncbi:hypothetical protein Vadar_007763 [Vaccinium darrowii]|uniref:Uncharacterized protein n=1 Tax=Vaccinium darrowii TaxID=229202 RepID=A0ACB7YDC5_9ERIC|nr:hypothetical protein Vadar_007763 [Vaccinium darrowii]
MDCSGALAAQEVEKFSPPQEKYRENDEGKTLQDVLTEEVEKWMKDAASSYSIVAALVATLTFAASITMLGSIYIDNGLPIFVKAFVVSNMFALSFSVASLLMFLFRMIKSTCYPDIFRKSSTPRQYTKGINSEAIIPKYLKSALHYLFALDLQQNSGGRRDDAAKSFGRIHTTHSLAQNSFEVVEALPTRKQPNDSVPLLSLGRLTLEGCVQEEKSQDLPRLMQIDGVEQRVTKSPRYLEGFTAQKWATRKGHSLGEKRPYEVSSLPMDLPRSLKLDCSGGLGAQSTVGLPDGGYVLSVLEKKIVGKTLKRKCKTVSLFSLEDDQQHGVKRWGDAAKSLGRKRICRQLVVQHVSRAKRIHRQHVFHWWLFQQSATGSPYGGHIQSLLMKEIVRETLKRKCRTSKWKDDVKNLGAKRIGRQLAIHRVSSRKHIIRPLAIHRSPFQQNWATLKVHCLGDERPVDHSQNERSRDQPEGCEGEIKNSTIEDLRPLLVFKRDYAVNQPEGRRIFSIDLEDLRQFISLRSADAVKELEALRMGRQLVIHCVSSLRHFIRTTMLICRPLVIHPLSSLELIIRPHAIHRLPFQQDPTLMECNITQLGGQDRSGSTASPSHNERTRDRPEGSKGKIMNLTIENLRSLGHLKRAEAAEVLGVSPATFKRHCRYLGIKEWPILPPKEVIIPPDQNGERNPSPMFITLSNNGQITTENEMAGQNLDQNTIHDSHRGHCGDVDIPFSAVYNEAEVAAGSGHCGDEHLPDSLEGPNFQIIGNGSIAEVENQNTIHDSHHGHCGDADVPFPDVYNGTEVAGGSDNIFEQLFESCNFTFPILHPTPHPQIASIQFPRENMGSFEDHRNLLAPQKEPLPAGSSISDLALSQAMPITPITTESSECRRDTLTSVVGHLIGSQSVPTNPHMTPLLTERQDSTLVKANATYGKHTIKLRLPLTSGITELKQVVSKQLKLGLDSFEVNYKDEHGEWILITLDEEVREHLQLTLSGNQVNKLWVVNKVPNTTDFCRNCECDKCRSFKGKRP